MPNRLSRSRIIAVSASFLALRSLPARGQSLQPIKFTGVLTDDLTPVYWALETGMYRRAGIDLQITASNSGTAATAAVVSGAYDLGKGSVVASLIAHLKGLPLVTVANGVLWDEKAPITLAVVAKDSTIKTGADLNNKIGSAPALNDLGTLGINVWIDKTGGDSRTVKWIEVPNSAQAATIAAHRSDVCTLNEPAYTAAIDAGQVRLLAPCSSAIAEHYVIATYFGNKDWVDKHLDAARSFARITYEAARYTNTHHPETEAMMSRVTKIPLETMRKIFRAPGATSSDPALLQPVIDVAAKYGSIPGRFDAKDAYITNP
jgi:NitT/TauT family transport system substrate-binding protein